MDKKLESMIRVNHAGEYGAKRIYEGQLKFWKDKKDLVLLNHMYAQELEHFYFFDNEIKKRKVRPTVLIGLWDKIGFYLGALTAILGKEVAMSCTEAIEEVIEQHYQNQIDELKNIPKEKNLRKMIKKFKQEESEHKDIGAKFGNTNKKSNQVFKYAIKAFSRCAITLSKKI